MSSILGNKTVEANFEIKDKPAPKPIAIPAFSDIAKSANDLLNKDFYHTAKGNLEVKLKAPNGVNFTTKGKSAHDGPLSGSAELKKQDVDNGIYYFGLGSFRKLSDHPKHSLSWGVHTISIKPARRKRRTLASSAAPDHDGTRPQSPAVAVEENPSIPPTDNPSVIVTPPEEQEEEQEDKEEDKEEAPSYPSPSSPFTSPLIHSLIQYRHPTGITLTSSWNTANVLDAKVELDQSVAKDVKLELLSSYKPANTSEPLGVKSNFFVKKSPFHIRAFVDLLKGPVATLDTVVGHEGFMVGGETSYDVQKATLTKYSAAVGYHHQSYAAAVTATNNFGSFAASYFHKVNSSVQAGTKATYDAKSAGIVGMELAGRYQLDPMTFVKGKLDNKGLAAVSYSTKINQGLTFGVGASFDTQKLNEAGHKIGMDFKFEG